MATTYKILGQSATTGSYGNGAQTLVQATNTNLYTVPAATQTIVSTITVANTTTSAVTYRIAVRPAGATLANQHYVAYDTTLAANDTTALTLGLTLSATDIITVYAATGGVTFIAYGSEIA